MGQEQNRSNVRWNSRVRSSRKIAIGIITALGCSVLALSQTTTAKADFDKKLAWAHLNKQVAFGPRFPGMEGHTKCRDWILEEITKSCENVRKQEFTHKWSKGQDLKMWNLIGEQNYAKAKTRILLIAHWDTRPTADQDPNEANHAEPILGANDGASGVAVLLELMRTLKDKLPKDTGVMYLMTDGEDVGPSLQEMFLGAKHFAKNMPDPKPDYGILIDMVGDKDLRVPVEPNSFRFAPKLIYALYDHARSIGLADTFPLVEGPWIEDDHICLNNAGLKTIDLIDFEYPEWHTVKDLPDRCSADSLEKVGRLLQTWVQKDPAFIIGG